MQRLKMLLQGCAATAVISILFSSFFVAPAFATATVTAVTDLTTGQGILPNSPPTALLKIEITFASGDTVTGIEAAVVNSSGLTTGDISELAIYSDTNNNGIFDNGDTRIAYKTNPVPGSAYGGITSWDWSSISEGHYGAPGDKWFYFIVVETSSSISNTDAFQGEFVTITGSPGGIPGGPWPDNPSSPVTCECKVVDVFYTESDTNLSQTWDLVSGDTETYWQPNYLYYAIAQEMTEPNEIIPLGTPHLYRLSDSGAWRYSFIDGTADDTDLKAAASNSLKFERRRKLMGMYKPTAVLGIKVAGKNQFQDVTYYDTDYFDTMVITFTDTLRPATSNFDPQTMLYGIIPGNETGSGVAVYQDTNNNDIFDAGDTALNIEDSGSWSAWSGDEKTLTLNFSVPGSNPQAAIPQIFDADLDDGTRHDTDGVDFFVVLRGNPNTITYGADFTIKVSAMDFRGADSPPASSDWNETREIKAVFELSDYTGTRVDPATTFPVIGINVNKGDASVAETLAGFTFYLKQTGTNFDPDVDLIASGVTVVHPTTGVAAPVSFSGWSTVSYLSENWWATTVYFNSAEAIPSDDTGADSGPDYLVRLTTSASFGYNKKIIAAIPDNGFSFGSGEVSANGTALITNANIDHGSNSRVYPDINPSVPIHNPILGNPLVVFSQLNDKVKINSSPTKIIRIGLASNTTVDTPVLKSVVVQVGPTNLGFTYTDLADMSTDPAVSGIGLYTSGGTPITLAFPPSPDLSQPLTENYRRYLLVLRDPLSLPQTLDITIKSRGTISLGDAMFVRVWGSEITPCSSYGLGFRVKDDSVTDTERHSDYSAYGAAKFGSDILTLSSALGGLPSDYEENWYLAITAGDPDTLGKIYKVISVADPATSSPDVTVEPTDLATIGTVSGVKLFKVQSTSYQNFSAPVVCSGTNNLNITEPNSPGETPIAGQYTIGYDADALPGTPLALYRVNDLTHSDTTMLDTGLSVGFGQTFIWNTELVPTGTYRIYGELGSTGDVATDYSVGTVTITNSAPTILGPLTITPSIINIGGTASIALFGVGDADSNDLYITFYSTDDSGADTRIAGSTIVSAPYPNPVTLSWTTPGDIGEGNRLLYAIVSDGVNSPVVYPAPPNGTPFVMQTPAEVTGSAEDQVIAGQGILPKSPPTAVLGLNLSCETGDPLASVRVTLVGVDGFSASDITGVYLYGDSNSNDIFDSGDSLLGTAPAPSGLTYTIPGSGSLPIDDEGGNAGIDYFIVIRTSNTIDHYDAFYAAYTLVNGAAIDGVYEVVSGTIRCECKIVDVFYTQSFHLEDLIPGLAPNSWDRYWMPNYLSYSIQTEMTEPNNVDPDGNPYPWYLTETGDYRYSYITGGPSTLDEYIDYTYAYSNLLKFERKRQLLQMYAPTAILGIKLASVNKFQTPGGNYDGDYLNTVIIDFTDTDSINFKAKDMLFPLNTVDEYQSGVALYRDNNSNGILDAGDLPVPLYNNIGVAQWTTDNQVTFNFGAEMSTLSRIPQTYNAEGGPDTDMSWNITFSHDRTGTDFLVVIRARPQTALDSKIKYGADFTAKVTTISFTPTFTGRTPLSSSSRPQWYPTREIKAVLELSDLTGSRIDPDSLYPLMGINVVDGPGLYEKILQITLQIKNEIGFDPSTDLSDILIYRNDIIQPGVTRSDWTLVGYPVSLPTEWWWESTVSVESGLDVPDTDTGIYQGDDYYLVLQASENLGYLDKITARILDGGIAFSGTTKNAEGTGLTTNALLPPVSNTRVHWDPFASPLTPLTGNVAVRFHDLIITPFIEADPDNPTAVVGLELSSNTVSDTQPVLKSLVVQLINTTAGKSYFDMNSLAVMTTDSNTSGLGIWKDDGDGVFDSALDTPLLMAAPPTQYVGTGAENYQRFIIVLDEAQPVATSFSLSGYPNYFVTIRAREESASDQLLMRFWGSEMKPPASYSLGFRQTNILSDDNITDTEAVTYFVSGQTTIPSTLTLYQALGGTQSTYDQNWYLVITGDTDTAKGAVIKILGVNAGLNVITCEDLSGLGVISQIRVFKLDGTSYRNHSVGVAFKVKTAVTLYASPTTSTIVLTWVDDTEGGGARTFDIERREKTVPVSPWVKIESDLPSASPELIKLGINTYQYVDTPPGTITYEYRVTVKQSGKADAVSNIVAAKLSAYFPYAPTDLRGWVGVDEVDLDWDWTDGYKINESGFSVERKGRGEPESSYVVIGTTSEFPYDNFGQFTDRSFTDTMLETETFYDYRVRAFKVTGTGTIYSDYSDPIEVEVLPTAVIPSSAGSGGGSLPVGPLAVGVSALLGWWKHRRRRQR